MKKKNPDFEEVKVDPKEEIELIVPFETHQLLGERVWLSWTNAKKRNRRDKRRR